MKQVYGKGGEDMSQTKKSSKIKYALDDKLYFFFVYVFLGLITLIVLYPLVYILSSSFSSGHAITTGKVILFPVEFSLEGYKAVFSYKDVLTGYKNTLIYTILGTFINISMTMITAYPLARRDLRFKGFFMVLFTFTMLFSGGMIPNYILLKDLKMIDTLSVMVVPGAISVYNMIIARTFIRNSIPDELLQASQIDGCSDFRYFWQIVLPLSKAILAVITLFYAVNHWNSYFDAFLYLNKRTLFPLQIFLREILIFNSIEPSLILDPELMEARYGLADLLKYSLIIVASAPILLLYSVVQKYFEKGVMIGSIKG